ncbi:phenylacetate--CoA ligase [Desulfuromonas carbonis]
MNLTAGNDRFAPFAELSFTSPAAIGAVQDRLLREHLAYLAARSPLYRKRFAAGGVDPLRIGGVADLAALPLTGKDDLQRCNEELLCVPTSEVVDRCLTSGTTGRPLVLDQTRTDLDRLAYNEARAFAAAGLGPADRVLVAAAIDRCFMAGMAYFLGLVRLGATAIRGGSSSIPALVELVRDQRPTALIGVPSLLLALGERMAEGGTAVAELGVKRMICIGEPVRNPDLGLSGLGRRLAELWSGEVYGTYASTEMATAFADCSAGCGGHLQPELMVVEILGEDGSPLPPGAAGEVVVTPLQVTGMPLLRYRTGDIAVLHTDPCPCGRNTPRLGPVLGRKAQMLKYRGTTVFPPAITSVLQDMEEVDGFYIEVFDDFPLSDRIRVVVATRHSGLSGEEIAERIAARTRVKPEVVLASSEAVRKMTLRPEKRKPVTFFDHRRNRAVAGSGD